LAYFKPDESADIEGPSMGLLLLVPRNNKYFTVEMWEQLSHYFEILDERRKARYLSADLDELLEKSLALASPCRLCERKCKVRRLEGEVGFCGAPPKLLISSEFLHYGEEPFFVPSHTIFFMGCNFRCVYCQNWTISQWFEDGIEISPGELARVIKLRRREGARNVNLVGGEPTPYLPWIIQLLKELKQLRVNLPIIWNSNFYMSKQSLAILKEIIDVWLPDFKYGNDSCAIWLSSAPNYVEIVTRNLKAAKGEMVIRHLVLPNHLECCSFPVLRWIARNRKDAIVNVMDQYTPHYLVLREEKFAMLRRRLDPGEFRKVVELARELGLCLVE